MNRQLSWSALLTGYFVLCLQGCAPLFAANAADPKVASGWMLPRQEQTSRYDQVRGGVHDRSGNFWIITSGEGLYRITGNKLTRFTTKEGLNDDTMWDILEDQRGRIWFGTSRGLNFWDGTKMQAVDIPTQSERPVDVWSLYQDKAGNIWIGASDGLYLMSGEKITSFLESRKPRNADGLRLAMVSDILEDRDGNMWFASGMGAGMEGLIRYDGKQLLRFNPGGEEWIRNVKQGPNGDLWLGTRDQGLWHYDQKAFSRVMVRKDLNTPLLLDRSGNLWFSGEESEDGVKGRNGIWRYDGRTFKNYSTKEGLGNYGVWAIFQDRAGDIWVGTRNIQLYRLVGDRFVAYSR